MKRETVPARALQFSVGQFTLDDNGESARSAPFRMVARSGEAIEHWYWGNVVHDLDGMRIKRERVPIDYAHDEKEVIGYANHFSTDSGDLVVSGALVPFKDSDRATEIIHKQKNGVPYEASINFGGDGIKLERIEQGHFAQVNGRQFSGPGVVIREWPLRGIAVCPYGADANTSTEFAAADKTVEVEFMEADMPAETNPIEQENDQQTAEAIAVDADTTAVSDTTLAESASEDLALVDAAPTALATRKTEGELFLQEFGQQGGVWFAQGLTFAEAQAQFIASLKSEVQTLRTRLQAKRGEGEDEPVEFSQHVPPQPKAKLIRIAGK